MATAAAAAGGESGGGLTDIQKLRARDGQLASGDGRTHTTASSCRALRRPSANVTAYAELLRQGEVRVAVAVAKLLAQDAAERDVVAAIDVVLHESVAPPPLRLPSATGSSADADAAADADTGNALPTPAQEAPSDRTRRLAGYQMTCWEVVDGILSCLADDYSAYIDKIQAHVAGWIAACAADTQADLLAECMGRWWEYLPAATMRACVEGCPDGVERPPLPTEAEEKELARRQRKRKRRDIDVYLEEADRAAEQTDYITALRYLQEYEEAVGAASSGGSNSNTAPKAALGDAFYGTRCEIYIDMKMYVEALADAGTIAARFSEAEGKEMEGHVYRAMGDLQLALLCFKECLAHHRGLASPKSGGGDAKKPAGDRGRDTGEQARVAKLIQAVNLEMLAAADPAAAVPSLRTQAVEAYIAGDYRHAACFYGLLRKLEPESAAEHLSNSAAAHIKNRMYVKALADADAVVAMKPQWGKGYLRKAKALVGLRRHAQAEDVLHKGLEVQPWCTNMQALLAKVTGGDERGGRGDKGRAGRGDRDRDRIDRR